MRARLPVWEQVVDRDGVGLHVEVHGEPGTDGRPTLVLVPPAPITHSRIWKGVLPTLARHHRVVTFDGRGNGRSGRPAQLADHTRAQNVADVRAVLDATGTDAAVLVAHCHANWWAVDVATAERGRVVGMVAIAPGVPGLGPSQPHWQSTAATWEQHLDDAQGWELYNRHVIVAEHRRWIEFFFDAQLVESHSSKQFEDAVSWAMESTGDILVASEEAHEIDAPTTAQMREQCAALRVPTLVVHGDRDVCQHVDRGRAFADAVGADLLVIEGGGHLVAVRDPVRVTAAILDFVAARVHRQAVGARR